MNAEALYSLVCEFKAWRACKHWLITFYLEVLWVRDSLLKIYVASVSTISDIACSFFLPSSPLPVTQHILDELYKVYQSHNIEYTHLIITQGYSIVQNALYTQSKAILTLCCLENERAVFLKKNSVYCITILSALYAITVH